MEILSQYWGSILIGMILLVSITYGYAQGFIKIILSLISFVATSVCVYFFLPIVMEFIRKETNVFNWVQNKITEWIDVTILDPIQMTSLKGQQGIIEALQLPELTKNMLLENNNDEVYEIFGATSFLEYLTASVADFVLTAILTIVLFIVVYMLIRIIVKGWEGISKIPLISRMDKLVGALIGGVQGVLWVWLILLIVSLISHTELGGMMIQQVEDSEFLTFFYNNNPFRLLLLSILNA